MKKNFFILHGHFYQPPRENPWSGYVDRQISAYPYNDWNIKIDTECYAACTRTPVLEGEKVLMTINCYEYLSFNFGPTLLAWMQNLDADPQTLKRIVEADKISVSRNYGHGNAIAQVYNHMIMPLASEKDQYTQALWGLTDFKRRFGRDSEGLWLGETAINETTAAILVDCGVKFVILSPFQAAAEANPGGQRISVEGGKINPNRPYILNTKNGPLAVFFYDAQLASGISFGNLLSDSNNLLAAVRSAFAAQNSDTKLVHTATDGEVYGHHKPYGNMALARLIYDIISEADPEFVFTNYGRFLAENPPVAECFLLAGKDGLGTAWSCAHGVGRWHEDCGCHTGGLDSWNQKWRTPLREAFDYLRDEIQKIIAFKLDGLVRDVWQARNDFALPFMSNDPQDYEIFFAKHQAKTLSEQERFFIIKMMEALHYAMLMYTSCGWFFSDISGIETVQDMLYAQRAYEFVQDFLDPAVYETFLNILDKGVSNVVGQGSGKQVLLSSVKESRLDFATLKEYVCWYALREGFQDVQTVTNEFSAAQVWADPDHDRYVFKFFNYMGLNIHTAFCLMSEGSDWSGHLCWIDLDENDPHDFDENFWSQAETWNVSQLSTLPLPLRIRFIARSIHYEMIRGYRHKRAEGTLSLDAVWGAENLLLPYEKRVLVFHYAMRVHQFALDLAYDDRDYVLDVFLREAVLLKKSADSLQEAALYLEPVVIALEVFLQNALKQQSAEMLKDGRIIFWGIKDSVSAQYMDKFRDLIYEYHKSTISSINNPLFLMEFKSLMEDLGFAGSSINI